MFANFVGCLRGGKSYLRALKELGKWKNEK